MEGSIVSNSSRECNGLDVVVGIEHHYRCYDWSASKAYCEIEWPCEVRQYLLTISPFITIVKGLLSYGTVSIIILGLFLNSLSLYTLISSGLARSGSGIYLVSLAICDCGNLLANYAVGVARGHLLNFNNYFMEVEWLCRFHGVFVEIFQLISAWIVVSFTVERCMAVWYPMWFRNTSRTNRARKVMICVYSILSVFSLSKLFLTGFEGDSVFGYPPCHSRRYKWQGMSYIRVATQTWIPTLLVFTFNCLMFYKLRTIKKARKKLTEYHLPVNTLAMQDRHQRKPSFIVRPSRTAPMLVAVSLAYLILVFPLGAVQTVELVWNVHAKASVPDSGGIKLRQQYIDWKNTKLLLKYIRSFLFGLYQINFAINFFLYFAAGVQFRLHLQYKIKKLIKRVGLHSTDSNNSEERPAAS